MRRTLSLVIVSALSVTTTTIALAQNMPQWVEIAQSSNGDRILFDLNSQKRQFDAGIKTNAFDAQLISYDSIEQTHFSYKADCLRGTLTLLKKSDQDIPLNRQSRQPYVPTQGSVGAGLWQYACSQF